MSWTAEWSEHSNMGIEIEVYRDRIGPYGTNRSQVEFTRGNNSVTIVAELWFLGMVLAVILVIGGI